MQKEYGWSDKKINNLTVRRFRQITAAINRRLYFEERRNQSLVTWQTRQLAGFIAAGYMTTGENRAIDAAMSLAIDKIEKLQLEEQQKMLADAPLQEEAKTGSYERFMGSMGTPTRWAGR